MSTSGSAPFDALRDALLKQPALRGELEAALDLNVRRVNPTERANRFGSGAAVEWILAAVAYSIGILSVPGGHNANGFDLQDLRNSARGMWSVKNQTKRGDWRLVNVLGDSVDRKWEDPTVFVSPVLPGLTFAEPSIHVDLAAKARRKSDAIVLAAAPLIEHAKAHPECVAPCKMPSNPGTGVEDPWRNYVEDLLSPTRFPQLATLFVAAKPVAGNVAAQVGVLAEMLKAGQITQDQFNDLVSKIA